MAIAILHLVGGGFGLLSGICGGAFLLVQSSLMKSMVNPQDLSARLQKHLEQQVPYTSIVQYVALFIDIVLSVMLFTAGLGLLSMRSWARSLSLVYAVLSILTKLFSITFFVFVTWPVMSAFLEAESRVTPPGPAATQLMILKATSVAGVVVPALFMIYPIVVLIVLLRPSVRRAFSEQPAVGRDDDYYEDDYDDDDRWRTPPSDKYRS